MPTRRELANAIRALAMDAVEKANSGHPGMPMGMADIAEVLWNDFHRHNPGNPGLAQPRPLRALQRPRLDAAVRAAAPDRLRPADGAAQAVPPVALDDPGPSGGRRHPGRGDHHRPAGPGHRQRRRLRAGREGAGRTLQPPGIRRGRPPHLGVLRRRLPDGGHLAGGHLAGRHLEAGQAGGGLRRQQHLHRRRGPGLVHRRHREALRGLRLARDPRRRRPRRRGRSRPRCRRRVDETRAADPGDVQDASSASARRTRKARRAATAPRWARTRSRPRATCSTGATSRS